MLLCALKQAAATCKAFMEAKEFLKYGHGSAECTNDVKHIYLNIYA